MAFAVPVKDMLFNIQHLSGWPELTGLPHYGGVDLDDASMVLGEMAKFCADVVAPLNAPGDRAGSRFEDGQVVLPDGFAQAYAQFVEMGWQGLQHPIEFGGQGLPRAIGAVATECLNAANMSFALCPLLTDGAIDALLTAASDEVKALYLEKLVSGNWTGTMNLTEPQAGSDLNMLRSRAVPQSDGSYQISGTKIFITYGEHQMAENTVHLVLARTPDAPRGVKGISLFLVPKFLVAPDGTLGARNAVRCQSIEHKLGIKASPTAILEFEGAAGFLIGAENAGLSYMFEMMNAARYAVGVQGVAIAERAYQRALAFAKERVQSNPVDGSSPTPVAIVNHPEVRRLLMRMRALTEAGRAMAAFAAGQLDLARHAATDDARVAAAALSGFLIPLVKGYCTENAVEVASLGIQVHGGMGFIEETGAAQHYRDARILPIYEGTTAIQANDLLGRKTLRDAGETAQRLSGMIGGTVQELSQGSPIAKVVGSRLAHGCTAFDSAVAHLQNTGKQDPNGAYGAAVPYLMLAGNLVAGWALAQSLIAAETALARGEDMEFLKAKIATARFYADHILPETDLQKSRILDGADSLSCVIL